jgi:DNA repair exonuclease SbcCD ATPase subunit/DNA repair exonuclease SbcCD nuclease subunit
MEIRKIKSSIKQIDKIYHVSDIHIRTLKRHKEYKTVFKNLFEYINTNATENSIAVVTGDIVHSKLDMSPELIQMLIEFFKGFTIPTIVILGNHDMNLNNLYRLDAISPILDGFVDSNIIFIKDNEVFEYGGITWNHMAVDITPDEYIRGTDINAPYKIALHHGAVDTATTDIGYVISNKHVTTENFKGHDLVLLGDIHKPAQFLNDEKTIGYPGSLIQQNHGEALEHGILVWDVKKKSSEFVKIENDYGYVTLITKGSKIVEYPKHMPKKPRIRIKFDNTDASDMKRLIATIKKRYNVQDISIQRSINNSINNVNANSVIGNIRDIEYQNTLLTDFVSTNFPQATDAEIDAIRHINRNTNSKLPVLESVRHVTWKPLTFEFDNMFSYGQGNKVDFSCLESVCGLFAANTSGKSSLLDAITYIIFDKCSKTSKAKEVLNNKQNTFRGKFCFELNGKKYTIEREGNKLKHGHVKVNVNFYTESENLNGEERSETNKNIRRYLGTYDDFILTAFSLQNDNNNFITKSQRERKDLLSQFMDMTLFEQIYQLASTDIKETAGKLKEYKKTDFATIITDADKIINDNKQDIRDLEHFEKTLQTNREKAQQQIVDLIEQKQPTTYEGADIEELEETETTLVSEIEQLQLDIESVESDISIINESIKNVQETNDNVDINFINERVEQLEEYQKKQKNIDQESNDQWTIVKNKQKKIAQLNEHEYDADCTYCTSNVFVQDALEAQKTIKQDQDKLKELQFEQVEIDTTVEDLEPYLQQQTAYAVNEGLIESKQNEVEKEELRQQILESDLQTKESELETTIDRQELFRRNQTAIAHNKQIDKKIAEHKAVIETISKEIKKNQLKIKTTHGETEVAKTNKNNAVEQLNIYKELETEYKAYEYYLSAIRRNGIPYELISKTLPKIETEINNVLNQVVDFNMVLETDGKNINGYIIYSDTDFWPLELTSGMERFISSLAIRIALINVSALPRPNFIAIDEGWGSLDQEHIASVVNLFEYFRTKFDFCIIISHVDTMRDMVDNLIEVNKINNYSQIYHT